MGSIALLKAAVNFLIFIGTAKPFRTGDPEVTGGAHPNPGSGALVGDKAANRRRAATDLFLSKPAFSAAIRAPFCDALDRQREAKRGEKINRASGDEFDACLDPAESTLILGSSNHQTFDRLGVLKYGMPDLRDMFASDVRWMAHYGFSAFATPTPAPGLV